MTNPRKTSNALQILLWAAQVILSLSFIWAAGMKLFAPADRLAALWPWTAGNFALVKITGVLDLLAGTGLILPWLLRIRPLLTVYAAYGTILLMVAAGIFHISRGEIAQLGANIFFALLAVFIAWGRRR